MFDIKCVMFLCVSLAVLGVNAGGVSFIEPCHYADSKCLLKSTKTAMPFMLKGIPELGIPSYDPLKLKEVHSNSDGLKIDLKDVTIPTLRQCEFHKVERPDKLKLILELTCPITATGYYKVEGNLFLLQVQGDDKFEVTTKKVNLFVTIFLKEVEKEGKKYYKFKSFDFSYEPLEKVYYKFYNLFHGDKAKAKPVEEIIDENWKEITTVLAKPIVREMLTEVIHGIEKCFIKMPSNELELA